jgi:hypothetical protein
MRRGRSFQPPWLYNTWEPFQRKVDEATGADLIQVASRMGMDVFTIDDGWQAECVDNRVADSFGELKLIIRVDPDRIPPAVAVLSATDSLRSPSGVSHFPPLHRCYI